VVQKRWIYLWKNAKRAETQYPVFAMTAKQNSSTTISNPQKSNNMNVELIASLIENPQYIACLILAFLIILVVIRETI
jgi:hypothetical protein